MNYADWRYYTGVYLGQDIDEAEFPRLALRASRYLDYYTQGRAQNAGDTDALKLACCALAELYRTLELAEAAARRSLTADVVKSESVGSHTVTYEGVGEQAANAASLAARETQALSATAQTYLAGTGLLYRGRGLYV